MIALLNIMFARNVIFALINFIFALLDFIFALLNIIFARNTRFALRL